MKYEKTGDQEMEWMNDLIYSVRYIKKEAVAAV